MGKGFVFILIIIVIIGLLYYYNPEFSEKFKNLGRNIKEYLQSIEVDINRNETNLGRPPCDDDSDCSLLEGCGNNCVCKGGDCIVPANNT